MVSHLRVPLGPHTQPHTDVYIWIYKRQSQWERRERRVSWRRWKNIMSLSTVTTNWVVATENIVIKFEWRQSCMNTRHPQQRNLQSHHTMGQSRRKQRLYRGTRPREKCGFTRERLMTLSRSNHSRPWRSLCRVFALAQASAYNVLRSTSCWSNIKSRPL